MASTVADDSPLRDRLILVVGARRSGTNWIGRILGTHPLVAYLPSETFLFAHLEALSGHFQHASMGSLQVGTFYAERSDLIRGMRALCDAVLLPVLDRRAGEGCDRLLERTPDHCRHLALISEVYPDAHVVHIIRDGRDVARSLASMGWGPGEARAGAEEWVASVASARAAGSTMDHYHEVRYESLLADPCAEVTQLYEALGLPVDPSLVESALTEAEVPFNYDPSMPAIAAEKWREGLQPQDLAQVEAVAGELLVELGYPAAVSSTSAAPSRRGRHRPPRAAAVVGRARRAARLPGRRRSPEPAQANHDLRWGQHTVDQFLGDVRSGRADDAAAILDPRVHVRVVTRAAEWAGRGPEAGARLIEVLAGDPVVMGPQVRSDVHPSQPAFTLVFAARRGAELESRTLVLFVRARRITRVAYYALG